MISKELAEKIVAEIPSASLRKAIEEQNWQFSDRDFFLIAAKYCKLLKTRWALLAEIIEQADEEISSWAKSYLAYEQRVKEKFCESDEKCVYEVRFLERYSNGTIASQWENYIFKDFSKAEKFCKKYLKKYDCYVDADIKKRLICDELSIDDYDYVGTCNLNLQGDFLSFDYEGERENACKGKCEKCKNPCVDVSHPIFPKFLNDYDIISYFDYKGKIVYGIIPFELIDGNTAYITSMEGELIDLYMAGKPLDAPEEIASYGSEIEYLRFAQHEHIELSEIEKLEYKDLPEKYQKIYDKLSAEYKKAYSSN